MGRDKGRDDEKFNCMQEHELEYVASLYKDKVSVLEYLATKCLDGTIKNFTHKKLYKHLDERDFVRK